jgi:vacuolar-type H+-ATPase subunit H
MRTREQDYAAKIYDQVKSVKNQIESAKQQVKKIEEQLEEAAENTDLKKQHRKSKKDVKKAEKVAEEYKTNAKNLAFLIRSAGLVQALYFTDTRNEGSRKLIQDLKTALGNQNLLDDARNKPINEYMYLTEKCLLALKWYKRCVDIHIKD